MHTMSLSCPTASANLWQQALTKHRLRIVRCMHAAGVFYQGSTLHSDVHTTACGCKIMPCSSCLQHLHMQSILYVQCNSTSRSPHHSQNFLSSRPSTQYRACTYNNLTAKQPCRLDRTVPLVRLERSNTNMDPPAGRPAPPQRPQFQTDCVILRRYSDPVEHIQRKET